MPFKPKNSKYWHIRYTEPSGKRTTRSARTTDFREAKAYEEAIRAESYKDKYSESRGHYTFDQLMTLWLDNVKDRERDKYAIRALYPHFTGMRLDTIQRHHIGEYKRARKEQGRSDGTVRKELIIFQSAINFANQECGWSIPNPIKGALPKKPKNRVRWITTDQYTKLIESCDEKAPHLPDMITLAVSTGMRSGEIKNLTWDQVDLKRRRILLNPDDQKNKEYGSIPLNDTAVRILTGRFNTDSSYVFTYLGQPIKSVKRSFKTACTSAGIDDFNFHDLRHTFASWLLQGGADLARLQQAMRHSDIRQTMIYSHLKKQDTLDTVALLDDVVSYSQNLRGEGSKRGK